MSAGRMRSGRIMIAGYYGMQNTGDDALLAACAWAVTNYLRPAHISATGASMPKVYGADTIAPLYVATPRFRGENGLRAYLGACRSTSVIFGGGSVFHSSAYLKSAKRFLRLAGKGPHAAIGVSIGPFADVEAERNCAELLRQFEFVGLRDRQSFEIARTLAPTTRCENTFDLAPLLLKTAKASGAHASASSRRGIGLALCDFERFTGGVQDREQRRRGQLKTFLDLLDPACIDQVYLIDFNGHPHYGDQALHREIAGHLDDRFEVRHLPYTPDPCKVLEVIGNLKALVAMRLHAAVFGYLAQTPTIIMSYHPKCRGWAEAVGMDGAQLFDSVDFDPAEVADCVHRALADEVRAPALPLAEAERLALNNWTWTHEYC